MILKVLSNINNSIQFYDIQEEGEKVFGFKTEGQKVFWRGIKWHESQGTWLLDLWTS